MIFNQEAYNAAAARLKDGQRISTKTGGTAESTRYEILSLEAWEQEQRKRAGVMVKRCCGNALDIASDLQSMKGLITDDERRAILRFATERA